MGGGYTILYIFAETLLAYSCGILICRFNDDSKNSTLQVAKKTFSNISPSTLTLYISLSIIIISFIWFICKWKPLYRLYNIEILSALGMGYYTLQLISYILDCYWGKIKPQNNFLKLFLFVIYFPYLTTGPINRYDDLSVLYNKHLFSYENMCHGAQRILYGLMKKLVVAERLNIVVQDLLANYRNYMSIYSIILVLIYPLLMYSDFSGCADIALGASELFDIKLPENFNNSFFSKTVQEFWQRWHITLGTWARDYVMYPFLRSPIMEKLQSFTRNKYGKKLSKKIVNIVALSLLWFVMGFWHGGVRYIVGVSLWYFTIMSLSIIFESKLDWARTKFISKSDSFSWHLIQSLRTYVIYAIGAIFFLAGLKVGFHLIKYIGKAFVYPSRLITGAIYFRPISISVEINNTRIIGEYGICIFALILMFITSILREQYGYAHTWLDKQCIWFRWFVYLALLLFVVIFGKYGPGYNASEFIYAGF